MYILLVIITWILTLTTLYIGYYFGSDKKPVIKLPKLIKKKRTLGGIEKLPQFEIDKKGTRLGETEDAMEETLDNLL